MNKRAAVIVAHPDDETLWMGGAMLRRPGWSWFILCLCRRGDPDRAPRFARVLRAYGADGAMGDLDDGPDQRPLGEEVGRAVSAGLPHRSFDVVFTHNPTGEYTTHRRHQETGEAVIRLWSSGTLVTRELRTFAYEDGGGAYLPRAAAAAISDDLPIKLWRRKRRILTDLYGFRADSWEVRTTPHREAFWKFSIPAQAGFWLNNGGKQ